MLFCHACRKWFSLPFSELWLFLLYLLTARLVKGSFEVGGGFVWGIFLLKTWGNRTPEWYMWIPCLFIYLFLYFLFIYLAGRVLAVACGIFDLGCGMQTLSCGMWDLGPWPGMKPRPPALGVQSLSQWTTREVPPPPAHLYLHNVNGRSQEKGRKKN